MTETEIQVAFFESEEGAGLYRYGFLVGAADISVGSADKQGRMELTDEVGDPGIILSLNTAGRCLPPIASRQTQVAFVRGHAFSIVLVASAGDSVSDPDLEAEALRLAKIVDAKLAATGK